MLLGLLYTYHDDDVAVLHANNDNEIFMMVNNEETRVRIETTTTTTTTTTRHLDNNNACPPGSFGTLQCALCPPGFYQDTYSQDFCLECDATNYNGFGANDAVIIISNNNNGSSLPLCAYTTTTPAPSSPLPTTTPLLSPLDWRVWEEPTMAPSNNGISNLPSFTPSVPSLTPSMSAPSLTPSTFESPVPSISPSISAPSLLSSTFEAPVPSISLSIDINATAVVVDDDDAICATNNTITLHGDCVDCPSDDDHHWFLLLAYGAAILILAWLFRFCSCPLYLFLCLDYLQTMGLLSLVRTVEWPSPLVNTVLRNVHYWAAFDWLGIVPCTSNNVQIGRFLLVAVPFHIATIPPDIAQLLSSFGCFSYDVAQEWIHRYTYQWAILVLLLTLQSVAVAVGETFLCQGGDVCWIDSSVSWRYSVIPVLTLFFGVMHLIWLCFNIWRKRDVIHQWPLFEFVIRKLAMVLVIFVWNGTTAMVVVVAIHVVSSLCLWSHDDNKVRRVVSFILMACLVILPVVPILHSPWAAIAVVVVIFSSVGFGLAWYIVIQRPDEKEIDDEVEEECCDARPEHDVESGGKSRMHETY